MRNLRKSEMKRGIVCSFGALLAMSLLLGIALVARTAEAQNIPVGPLVELSRPNAVGSCNDGFNLLGTWPTDDAEEPFVAGTGPNSVVASGKIQ